MAQYQQITDDGLRRKTGARYQREIAALQQLGFRSLAPCLEVLGAFSALYQFPVLLLTLPKREVLVFPWPLRLAVANALLCKADTPTIALCMGMGVKLYSAFTDGTLLISATFQSHAVPSPASAIVKSPACLTLAQAWSTHQQAVLALQGKGKAVRTGVEFEDYIAHSRLEENTSQYQ